MIKIIVINHISNPDIYGNCYGFSEAVSTETEGTVIFDNGCFQNSPYIARKAIGDSGSCKNIDIHYPIREYNRLRKLRKPEYMREEEIIEAMKKIMQP